LTLETLRTCHNNNNNNFHFGGVDTLYAVPVRDTYAHRVKQVQTCFAYAIVCLNGHLMVFVRLGVFLSLQLFLRHASESVGVNWRRQIQRRHLLRYITIISASSGVRRL